MDVTDNSFFADVLMEHKKEQNTKKIDCIELGYVLLWKDIDLLWGEVQEHPSARLNENLRALLVKIAATTYKMACDLGVESPVSPF